ncbi:hypothetical protein K2Y11_23110 [bacterium]|nr:hypothetical protein [bacterium]
MSLEFFFVAAFFAAVLGYPIVCALSCVTAHSDRSSVPSATVAARAFDEYTVC